MGDAQQIGIWSRCKGRLVRLSALILILKLVKKFAVGTRIHYCVHGSPPLVHILSQINSLHNFEMYFSYPLINV
jgi:hypothetical protein